MKYKLETIPVWDSLQESKGCLLCHLMEAAEQRYIAYYLGSSVMNPETRVRVNDTGFCPGHYQALAKAGKPNSMALIAHTHLEETERRLQADLSALAAGCREGKSGKVIERIRQTVVSRDSGCLICGSKADTLNRYAYTFCHLWYHDKEFRSLFTASKGLCLHHFPAVLAMGREALKPKERKDFYSGIAAKMLDDITVTLDDVLWMTQMYKSENRDKDWRGCEHAQMRAVDREVGRNRTTASGER